MKESEIMTEINSKVLKTQYGFWRIGLTHDLAERKKYWSKTEYQSTTSWKDWQADSLSDAQDIESYFINKGMKGGTGGDLSPNKAIYVYVF